MQENLFASFNNLPNSNKTLNTNFIDLFAGVGGIKIGFEQAGFNCVFSNDFDKNCQITFHHNFASKQQNLHLSDLALVSEKQIPDANILVGGFPCQPFSIAGYQHGFNDARGNVFFEIVRILEHKKPAVIFLENVKNLKNHNQGKTIKTIYQALQDLGYFICDQVLNAMEYANLPQNRERIYIVGFKSQKSWQNFSFPKKIPLTKTIANCLETQVAEKYYYNNKPLFEKIKNEVTCQNSIYQWRRKYVRQNKNALCPTLTANMGMGGHNVPIIIDNHGIRKLTPRECANFQGFPCDYQLPSNLPDSALYKQFGNSVAVPLIKRIAEQIKIAMLGANHPPLEGG